ncbi:uncharacterized protein [Antedon mediterranea]|uniref:uncharacterized protein n=1 Tax=Antedon mediterranea TaxID=105859 RepID=UPI003AF5233A
MAILWILTLARLVSLKIASDEVGALTDAQLTSLGVATLGDRQRLRANCRQTGSILSRFLPVGKTKPYAKKQQKQKISSWTRKVVCLAEPDTDATPKACRKQMLAEAGLGGKNVTVPDINATPEEFETVLFASFPKLKNAGGFEIMLCFGNERKLLPLKGSYTPLNIRDKLGQGRIYLRPI